MPSCATQCDDTSRDAHKAAREANRRSIDELLWRGAQEEGRLEELFEAFCEGVARTPDSDSESGEEGGGWFYDRDAVTAGAMEGLSVGEEGRFEDAEEDEEAQGNGC